MANETYILPRVSANRHFRAFQKIKSCFRELGSIDDPIYILPEGVANLTEVYTQEVVNDISYIVLNCVFAKSDFVEPTDDTLKNYGLYVKSYKDCLQVCDAIRLPNGYKVINFFVAVMYEQQRATLQDADIVETAETEFAIETYANIWRGLFEKHGGDVDAAKMEMKKWADAWEFKTPESFQKFKNEVNEGYKRAKG